MISCSLEIATLYMSYLGSLGSAEENTKLSAVLDQLSEVYLKVEKIHEEQAKVNCFLFIM